MGKKVSFRTLIVDDHKVIRRNLALQLGKFTEIELVGEASTLTEAIALGNHLKPDVVFLDIELGDGFGFDALDAAWGTPQVIFISAHDRYAVKAFDADAVDYLVKPIRPERLALSVARLHQERRPQPTPPPVEENEEERAFVPVGGTRGFIARSAILRLETEGNYTRIFTTNGEHFEVKQSLATWERQLPPESFVRINRNEIVQWHLIDRVTCDDVNGQQLFLVGEELPRQISRRARSALSGRFKSLLQQQDTDE